MERKKMLHTLQEARGCLGSYDEFPTLPVGTDPMPYLSRNRVPQPFYLASETDRVVIALSGRARILLPGAHPSEIELGLGEAAYIPAGQASRQLPITETVQLTYKAEPPGWEAAIWFCENCGAELFRLEVDTARELAQDGYWRACQQFNEEAYARTCGQCGATHETVDLTDIHWQEVAQRIREADAPAAPAARAPMEVPAG